MSRPTHAQVTEEIDRLTAQLTTVRPFSMFGDDNLAKIRGQIAVADGRLDEDEIYEQFGEYSEGESDGDPENFEFIADLVDMHRWLKGEEGVNPPSEGWVCLEGQQ